MMPPCGALALPLLALASAARRGGLPTDQVQADADILNFSEDPASALNLPDSVNPRVEARGLDLGYDTRSEGMLEAGKVVMRGPEQAQLLLNEFVCVETGQLPFRALLGSTRTTARVEVGESVIPVGARTNSSFLEAPEEMSQIDFGGCQLALDRPLEHGELEAEEPGLDAQQRDLRLRTQDEAGLPEAALLPPRR